MCYLLDDGYNFHFFLSFQMLLLDENEVCFTRFFLFFLLFIVPCLVFALYIYRLIFEVFLCLQLRDLRKDNNRLEKDLEDKDKVTMTIYWNAR